MPMKRSGCSVTEASRVIEIDDVLELTIASALRKGRRLVKILRFTSSFSEAASMMRSQSPSLSWPDVVEMRASVVTRQKAVDRRQTGLQSLFRNIVHHDFEAGLRTDMRDAAAHLPGSDHAN